MLTQSFRFSNINTFLFVEATLLSLTLIGAAFIGFDISDEGLYAFLADPLQPNPQAVFNYDDQKGPNLGVKLQDSKQLPTLDDTSEKTLDEIPSRVMTMVLDRGVLEKGIKTDTNADPMKYQAQSLMRYNTLNTQELHMQVPLNTNLRAGDTIKCMFPKVTSQDEDIDDEMSGLYLIKELRHHFGTSKSETSMKLIRDTFGLYGVNNDNGGK